MGGVEKNLPGRVKEGLLGACVTIGIEPWQMVERLASQAMYLRYPTSMAAASRAPEGRAVVFSAVSASDKVPYLE